MEIFQKFLKQNSNRFNTAFCTPDAIDCNALEFGIYVMYNPQHGVPGIMWQVVISTDTKARDTSFQICYDLTSGKQYWRRKASGEWNDWSSHNV